MYTRQEILENRQAVIKFLKGKDRQKAVSCLDIGKGERCCLGHMCYALNIPKSWDDENKLWVYDGSEDYAPKSMMDKVGLYENGGRTSSGSTIAIIDGLGYNNLAKINDETEWTPQQIGAYLETVIEGGRDTPWFPLSDYPEIIE